MNVAPSANWRFCTRALLAVAIILTWSMPNHAQLPKPADDTDRVNAERSSRVMKEMRMLAKALKIVRQGAKPGESEKLIEEPLFRHNGLARIYEDGTTWAWGAKGRPIAFCKLFTSNSEAGFWTYCNALTSTDLIEMYRGDERIWYPQSVGIAFKPFSDFPSPSEKSTVRLRQMKELARRFSAHEVIYPPVSLMKSRHELQLKPQPVHRYDDTDQSIVDGAVFIIAHEAEPEMILLIEAIKPNGKLSWQFGAVGIGGAEFHLALDGAEVYTRPWAKDAAGLPTESFFGFVRHKDK